MLVYCRLELHLVGGFEDDRRNSEEVSLDLFGELDAFFALYSYIPLISPIVPQMHTSVASLWTEFLTCMKNHKCVCWATSHL